VYCALGDVEKLFPTPLHAAFLVAGNITDWGAIIVDVSAEIDSALCVRYTVPITGAVSLGIVKSICARMAAMQIHPVIYGASSDARLPEAWKAARAQLAALAKGEQVLSDAGALGDIGGGDVGHPHGTFRVLEDDPLIDTPTTPVFDPNKDF